MKHHHHPFARLLAFALLATVLFTHVAIAGYVCPPEAGAMMDASTMAVASNCQDMDEAQPALCADHRHDGRHWADANGHAPDLGMLPAASGLVHILPPTLYAGPAYLKASRPAAVPGPIYLATARLRI